MKIIVMLLSIFMFSSSGLAQNKWFNLYTDSVALVNEANAISNQFVKDVKRISNDIAFNPKVILNTQPYLIFYINNVVNLPLWEQLDTDSKGFFYHIGGSEADGKKLFGLLFNGFYLVHELAHGVQDAIDPNELIANFEIEYAANVVAILYWRKTGKQQQLKQCYEMVKKALAKLPNPVPAGKTNEEYFSEHFHEALQDPFTYGYMQFSQFIEIYEDKSLPDFDTFLRAYIERHHAHGK